MKKFMVFLLCMLCVFVNSATVATIAAQEEEPLFKYVKHEDGSYGYDPAVPVYYYQDSTEQVTIPAVYTQPKEQFKAAWVATIFNLHFPQLSSEDAVKSAYSQRLDTFESWNMNAMIFQVRPVLDAAYYQSDINPASAHFTGKQGTEASFDPMPWMIEETHKRGMEFHAWFNPYRITNTAYNVTMDISEAEADLISPADKVIALNQAGYLADTNFAVLHPEYVLEFKGKLFLNPGEPAVIQHVVDTIAEFITKYDTDAIHFDDYFYPYKVGDDMFGTQGEDQASFEKYGSGYTDIEAWRRDNVTALIDAIRNVIDTHNQTHKTAVQFGISPFGIWEHKANDERGSNTPTGSSQSYSRSIFADTYQWVKDNKLDYIAPQIYWSFGQAAAPYGELARWWNTVAEGTNVDVYVGHANYKYLSNGGWDAEWMNPEEINNQLKFNQNLSNITGSSLYSYNDLLPSLGSEPKERAKNAAIEILKNDTFSTPSLTPSREYLSHGDVFPVDSVRIENGTLIWNDTLNDNARFYVIYAGDDTDGAILAASPENIVDKVMFSGAGAYTLDIPETLQDKHFAVTVLDRAFVETAATSDTDEKLEATLGTDFVSVYQGSVLDEETFIQMLDIKASVPVDITTTFTDAVDLDTIGTYTVDVTLTKTVTRSLLSISLPASYDTLTLQVSVNVIASETPLPENPEDPTAPIPETEDPSGTPLPQTGVARFLPITGTILALAGVFCLLHIQRVKRKLDVNRK